MLAHLVIIEKAQDHFIHAYTPWPAMEVPPSAGKRRTWCVYIAQYIILLVHVDREL